MKFGGLENRELILDEKFQKHLVGSKFKIQNPRIV